MDGQIHVPRYIETQKQLESDREMGWVALGHTFTCGHVNISLACHYIMGKAGYMLLVYTCLSVCPSACLYVCPSACLCVCMLISFWTL